MNANEWIAASCIISAMCAIFQVITFLIIVPILKRLDRHEERFVANEARIGQTEVAIAGEKGAVLEHFVRRSDFRDQNERREKQLALINQTLDQQTIQMTRIETKVNLLPCRKGDPSCDSRSSA